MSSSIGDQSVLLRFILLPVDLSCLIVEVNTVGDVAVDVSG